MKKSKKLIIIIGAILIISIIVGVVLANNTKKKNKIIGSLEINTDENEIIKEEPINVIVEDSEKQEDEPEEIQVDKVEEKVSIEEVSIEEQPKVIDNQDKPKTTTSSVNSNSNKQTSNSSKQTTSIATINTNAKAETKIEVQTTPPEPVKVEEPQVAIPKQEESKPVENKPVEKPVQTAPVRTYQKNETYISKLRSTIVTEVTNNLPNLNKYGITDVSQYQIIEDSSICTYNGGNRSGWTYENVTAYNTFKSSILKGTSIKIYAVDEYQNGEFIQTLCYYGH